MKEAVHSTQPAEDKIQERIADYACDLKYSDLPPDVVHATKIRIIDTLGASVGGFYNEPSHLVREFADATENRTGGATILGTRLKTDVAMAAFVNATTARDIEMTDTYHWPKSAGGHPSDVITAIFSLAEQQRASGKDFIAAVVVAYEVYLRLSDFVSNPGIDHTSFCCLGVAVAAGRFFGLSRQQMAHCVAMAVIPNVSLRQARSGKLTMWKSVASGQAALSGINAAMLARANIEGPNLPFEGKAGWCDNVARQRFNLDAMGGGSVPYKIPVTRLKLWPANGVSIASILAAVKLAPQLKTAGEIDKINVEVYHRTMEASGKGDHNINPQTREAADHSAYFLIATTLLKGTVTLKSYTEAGLWDADVRALMKKIVVVENPEFTAAHQREPQECRSRITITLKNGKELIGLAGGKNGEMSDPISDDQISDKFRALSEDDLGVQRAAVLLEKLWHLEDIKDMSVLPADFVIASPTAAVA